MKNHDFKQEKSGLNKDNEKIDLGYTISKPTSSLKPQVNKPKNKK